VKVISCIISLNMTGEDVGDGDMASYCVAVVNKTCHGDDGEFFCVHDKRCIADSFVCNGKPDCSDAADEQHDLCKSSSSFVVNM